MHTIIKTALTAVCLVALVWPLLFWGKPALPEQGSRHAEQTQPQLPYNILPRHDILW
jgi:hypothetical protein